MFRAILCAALMFVGCGDSSSSNGSSDASGGTASDATGGTIANAGGQATTGGQAASKIVKVTYTIVDAQNSEGISGAEICIDDRECIKADESGKAEVELEVGSTLSASAKAPGYATARGSAVIPDTDVTEFSFPLIVDTVVDLLGESAGVESLDESKGHIAFLAVIPGDEVEGEKAGIGLTLTPADEGSVGPKYTKEGDIVALLGTELYDDSLMATTSSGAANYYNLTPGQYTIATTGSEGCTVFTGIDAGEGKIQFDIKADELTYVSLTCPE